MTTSSVRLAPLLPVLVVQALLVAYTFPVGAVWTAAPMMHIDHPFHLYQVYSAMRFADQGHLTGYDPFFGAGYVAGVTFNASAKAPTLFAWMVQGVLPNVVAYKLFIVAAELLAPLAAVAAAMLAGLRTRLVLLVGLLAVALWWASEIHWYHTAGMASFVVACFFALPYCVLLDRAMTAPRASVLAVALGLAGAALFFTHPFFVFPVVFFCLIRLAIAWPSTSLPVLVSRFGTIAVLALVLNLPWLLAMHNDPAIGKSDFSVAYQMVVDPRMIWSYALGLIGGPAKGAKVDLLLFLLALLSLRRMTPSMRVLNLSLVGTWFALAVFAAFGAALPFIGSVQPNRFASSAYIFLLLPAGFGVAALTGIVRDARGVVRVASAAGAVVLAAIGLFVMHEVKQEVSYGSAGHYGAAPPDVQGTGPVARAVLDWVRDKTDARGRILFETSFARVHDGGHIVGYVATQTRREFIGGPYNNFFAGTRDGWMFGRPIDAIDPKDFLAYLRLYNIGWMVVHSKTTKDYLHRLGGIVEPQSSFEGLETFVVKQTLDFVAEGQGRVRSADFGKLVVERRGAAGEPIVLKYHYVPGLHALDGSTVEPQPMLDDPVPFVRVTPRNDLVELVR